VGATFGTLTQLTLLPHTLASSPRANSKSVFSSPGQKVGTEGSAAVPVDDVTARRAAMAEAAEARMAAIAAHQDDA